MAKGDEHELLSSTDSNNLVMTLPDSLLKLYPLTDIHKPNDALVLFCHVIMLESDYVPKGVPPDKKFEHLPDDWKKDGIYKIQYFHLTCPEALCQMTCVPMGHFISIHGTVLNKEVFCSATLVLTATDYVYRDKSFTDGAAVYHHVPELIIKFKDSFAFTFLMEIQSAFDIEPTFGFSVVPPDLKFLILSYLPVKSLVAASAINKEFHDLANRNFIWKLHFLKDFRHALPPAANKNYRWKEFYIREYCKKKEKASSKMPDSPKWPQYVADIDAWLRPIFINDDDLDFDFRTGLAHEVEEAFPHLRGRFQTPNPLLHIIHKKHYM